MSLVRCAAAPHSSVGAKAQTSQPGLGAGRKCLLLSSPCDTGGSGCAVALSHSCSRQPGPHRRLRPRNALNRGYKWRWQLSSSRSGVERLLLLLQRTVHEGSLRWRVGKVSFFFSPQGVLALKTVNLQRKENADSAAVAKCLHQILLYSIYTFKVSPH